MNTAHSFADLRPAGGFGLIKADPPWRFDNWSGAGEEKNASAHYGSEGIDWIKELPVSMLAACDCLLWLWATNPMLPEAIDTVRAWGFTFKTAGTWCKRTSHGKDAFGTGYLLRSSNEPFLIATRGAPKTTRATRSTLATYDLPIADDGFHLSDGWPAGSITIEGRARAHSEQPEEGFAACEALMPDARRLELFSRTNRKGWSSWGNETGKLGEVA